MKVYFKIVVSVFIFLGLYGFLMPYLVSQASDVTMLIAIFMGALLIPSLYLAFVWITSETDSDQDQGWK